MKKRYVLRSAGGIARKALIILLAALLTLPSPFAPIALAVADEISSLQQNVQNPPVEPINEELTNKSELKIAVLSDMHYYPVNYVSDCEDYDTYVGGDPKMLEESGSIADAAVNMIIEDKPDIVLVSGDLTKDGERLGHEQLAQKLQRIEDEAGSEVFVINGNHDVYNYLDACTFENGKKESTETVSPDDFKTIYANFGYDGSYEAQYFTNPNHDAGEIAGELSYSVDLGKFTIVAIDSCMYSPDAGTGYDSNEHITAGRVDEDLRPWAVQQIQDAEAEGDTVIGLMHHGLVPHFEGEESILSEYVVEDWRSTASAFADAGMRYIFTGHMHANDIAEFTSNSGNHITDLETGSLSSWMSPVRTVTLTKGNPLNDGTNRTHETFNATSESIKSIDFVDHTGNATHIDDFKTYTQQKLYPKELINNMASGMLRPVLQEMSEQGLKNWLAENLPGVDIDAMALQAIRDALSGGMEIELGSGIGRISVQYRNGGIVLTPSGTAGWALDEVSITDAQLLRIIDGVLAQVETQYIDNPEYLLEQIDSIVTQVSNYGVSSLNSEQRVLYELVLIILTGHYAGSENPPQWAIDAVSYIETGEPISGLIQLLVDDLMPVIDNVLSNTSIDTGIAFSGLWKTAIDAATDDGNLKSALNLFGFDDAKIRSMIEGLIGEYMSPSFLTGMGSLLGTICNAMLYDTNGQDDVIDGEGRTITFDGSVSVPDPSIESGQLPTQVTMSLGPDAKTSRAIRWYTAPEVTDGTIQVATDADFQNVVQEVSATSEVITKPKTHLNLGLISTYGTQKATKHSGVVSGLAENTDYYYRVGDKDHGWWSDPIPFTTGAQADDSDTFSFINVNDSQGMVKSDYDVYLATLGQAHMSFPDAAFTLHAGDFVDDGANEDYWTWALDDTNNVAQGMAMTPAAGNHEERSDVEGITDANPIVSHFDLANVPEGQDFSSGVYYSYTYKNALFVVLNTNDTTADGSLSDTQYSWAYDTLSHSDAQWKIVLMHKSPYSNGPHQDDEDVVAIRAQMNVLAASCDVDLVLSGHDHVYNRTPNLVRGAAQEVATETQTHNGTNYETMLNPSGTTFVIAGTAGVKNYVQTTSSAIPSAIALDLSVPVYSGVSIDGDHLYYQAYKVESGSSTLIDSFAISKAEEDKAPAWKQVEELIAALPEQSDVTKADEEAIVEARAAYNNLSQEDKENGSNYDRLVAAEKMLSVIKSAAGKRTVTVSNADDFVAAVNDSSVGTIITTGSFEFDEGGLFDDGNREIYVDRDLIVGGTGELKFCRFHVRNGATLVFKDSLYVNDTRSQGSMYDALNPVEVEANSTFITTGSVSLRTEYGRGGATEGICVKLLGSGSTAILGSSGTYWASEGAVYSPASGTNIIINDGTFNAKNNTRFIIDTYGDVTVNGGTISSLWTQGTLRINGGTFEHQDSASSTKVPVKFDGANAYITGGTIVPYNGTSMDLGSNSKVHILASNNGNVKIGNSTPYVGSVATTNYKDVTIGYVASNGWGSSDGVYRVDGSVAASSVEGIAALNASQLSNTQHNQNGNYMDATVPNGTSTVFGKYWLYGNGKGAPSGSGITGGGQVIVYGPVRTIQNNPVTGVTIDGEDLRVVDLRQEGSNPLRLNGYTTPDNAFDNSLQWSTSDESVASAESSAGQGVVNFTHAGGVTVTARATSNQNASDSVDVIAVQPTLTGVDVVDDSTSETDRTFFAAPGFVVANYTKHSVSFTWSTDNEGIATVDDQGVLTMRGSGNVKVTATLCVDGKPTEVTVSKDVVCRAKPEITESDINLALDIKVDDTTDVHEDKTFSDLLADSYTVGDIRKVSLPSEGLAVATDFLGITQADYVWQVDVTIKANPYVSAYDSSASLTEGTHALTKDTSAEQTVTLEWDYASASWKVAGEDANNVITFKVECAPEAPAAPSQSDVANLAGISVTLVDKSELNGAAHGGTHQDAAFVAQPQATSLIETSFTIGEPHQNTEGVWVAEVTLSADAYLDAYAETYGSHYYASADERGQRTFTLVYDDASKTWSVDENTPAAYTFEIACLSLQPISVEKYVGDGETSTSHFPDPYIEDEFGQTYTIDELNELLSNGQTARIAYFNEDGTEIDDDTQPGSYIARIVVDGNASARTNAQSQTLDIEINGETYTFTLVDGTLTVRSVSDSADAEQGKLDVALIAPNASEDEITGAIAATSGGVVASLPDGATLTYNGNSEAVLTSTDGVKLLSDELLGSDGAREKLLADHAASQGYSLEGKETDFRYLDLVDGAQSNIWVSSDKGVDVYWRLPEGVDETDNVQVLRFDGLHRTYDDTNLEQVVSESTVKPVENTQVHNGYVSFHVAPSEFCPMVLSWDKDEPTPQTVVISFNPQGGTIQGSTATVSQTMTYGSKLGELPEPTRQGFEFVGWFTESSGGTQVSSETVIDFTTNTTYYAQWKLLDDTQTVSLTLNPGAEGMFADHALGEAITKDVASGQALSWGDLPVPTREGYAVEGWYMNSDFAADTRVQFVGESDSPTTFSTDTTLYAKWVETLSEDVSITPVTVPYDGSGHAANVSFTDAFPTEERDKLVVEYCSATDEQATWTTDVPVAAGSYRVRLTYEGTENYQGFQVELQDQVIITPAQLTQTGLIAEPSEVEAGTKLSDVALIGSTVVMDNGTVVSGSWAWASPDTVLNASGTYEAVFTPDDPALAANSTPLSAEVSVAVAVQDEESGPTGDTGEDSGNDAGNQRPPQDSSNTQQNDSDQQSDIAQGATAIPATSDPGFVTIALYLGLAGLVGVATSMVIRLRKRS